MIDDWSFRSLRRVITEDTEVVPGADDLPAAQVGTRWDRRLTVRKIVADQMADEIVALSNETTLENAHAQRVKLDAKKWNRGEDPGRA